MTQMSVSLSHPVALDHNETLVLAIELSSKSWVLAAQVPGLTRVKARACKVFGDAQAAAPASL